MIEWIKKVVKSRLIKDKDLPQWHKERLKICSNCKYNFKNKPVIKRTFKDYYWYVLNGLNTQCTICNCGIKFKTRLKEEYCALENIGKEPKWDIIDE